MYPVSLGFEEAERRMKTLLKNGHHAEALITSVFSLEKTMRRVLRFFAVSRGFTSKQAEVLFGHMGFKDLKEVWFCFDPQHRSLSDLIGNAKWQHVPGAVTMRNKLAHGERVYKLKECKEAAERVLNALNELRGKLQNEVQFDGWSRVPVRKVAKLPWVSALTQRSKRTPRAKAARAG